MNMAKKVILNVTGDQNRFMAVVLQWKRRLDYINQKFRSKAIYTCSNRVQCVF